MLTRAGEQGNPKARILLWTQEIGGATEVVLFDGGARGGAEVGGAPDTARDGSAAFGDGDPVLGVLGANVFGAGAD